MKSNNAERLVIREFGHGEPAAYLDDVVKAVELAEEDARNRAVRALRDDCKNQDCDLALLGEPCGNCEVLERFLCHYDNEN